MISASLQDVWQVLNRNFSPNLLIAGVCLLGEHPLVDGLGGSPWRGVFQHPAKRGIAPT